MSATSPREYKAAMTADVTLPSGKVFTLRRPPLHVWKAHGRIPNVFQVMAADGFDALARAAQVAKYGGDVVQFQMEEMVKAQKRVSELSESDRKLLAEFEQDLVLAAVVLPLLVREAKDDPDALCLADLDPNDFNFIAEYALNNAPDVPVATIEGGTMPESTVRNFRQKPTGKRASAARGNVRALQRKTK